MTISSSSHFSESLSYALSVRTAWRNGGLDGFCALVFEDFRGCRESARRFGHIVDNENVAAFDFADKACRFDNLRAYSAFGDKSQLAVEKRGVSLCAF